LDDTLLSRIEDAGLNASAPPQQRWMDGWLLRLSPGKARRARCVNALAAGRLPLLHKLQLAAEVFAQAQLPMVVRITCFTQPPDLDTTLADMGWQRLDETRVMVAPRLPIRPSAPESAGLRWRLLPPAEFAAAVGALRRSPLPQVAAHAQRLASSPVPYEGYALCDPDGQVLACGQLAMEHELVGLYDVFTHPDLRGRGLAHQLCERLLTLAALAGARVGYLQVESENTTARSIYKRLGFVDGYSYHYRQPPAAG